MADTSKHNTRLLRPLIRLQFMVFWLLMLGILPTQKSDAALSITVKPEGPSAILIKTPGRQRYVTDAAQVRLLGDLGDPHLRFALLIAHDASHAIYPEKGVFEHVLALHPGSNAVEIEIEALAKQAESIEIIRLMPHRLRSLAHLRLGGPAEVLIHEPTDEVIQTSIPCILAEWNTDGAERIHLRVHDQYGNPVQVSREAEIDLVKYTLREGMNSLVFRSVFDGKVFGETQLNLSLSNVLRLIPENTQETVWFEPGSARGQFRTSRPVFRFSGRIDAMESGLVQMGFSDRSLPLEVKDRHFEGVAPLRKDHLNLLRFSASIEDQTYYETLEIAHVTPKLGKRVIRPARFDKDHMDFDEPIPISSGEQLILTHSPLIRISGLVVMPGTPPFFVRNLATGTVTEAGFGKEFEALVVLRPAKNELEILAGKDQESISLGKTTVFLRDFLTIETVNDLPYEGEIVFIEPPLVTVKGTIPSVNEGVLFLEADGEYYEYPITEGAFTAHAPAPVPSEHPTPIRLLWHSGDLLLQRTLFVQSDPIEVSIEDPGKPPAY